MPGLNRNVGIGGLDTGLCVIPSGNPEAFVIGINEAGLQEATIKFATFNPSLYRPARGTKCPDFIAGNTQTGDLLALFPYLACQSSQIHVNSEGDGVHGVDVLVQGASFEGLGPSPVEAVDIVNRGEYSVVPGIVFLGGAELAPAVARARLRMKSIAIHSAGSGYIPGNELRVTGGTYDNLPNGMFGGVDLVVQAVGGGGAITEVAVLSAGNYSEVPANPVALEPAGATFDIIWELRAIEIQDGGSYNETPSADVDGGVYTIQAVLGTVHMGGIARFGSITKPYAPVTTVKDTVEIPIFAGGVLVSKVTIDYRAIELSFDYVAERFADLPRFIGDQYPLVDGEKILIDATNGTAMVLRIVAVSAVAQITDANGTVTDGKPIAIDEATWRAAVRYIGDAAQFVQAPAGAMWHVTETTTIKIFPVAQPLPPAPPPPQYKRGGGFWE